MVNGNFYRITYFQFKNFYKCSAIRVSSVKMCILEMADVLQEVRKPIASNNKCSEKVFGVNFNPKYKICAGGEMGRDSCNGDSGSAMFDSLKNSSNEIKRYKLVGIVSYGTGKCGRGVPAVYVKVAAHLDWILESLGKYQLCLHLTQTLHK